MEAGIIKRLLDAPGVEHDHKLAGLRAQLAGCRVRRYHDDYCIEFRLPPEANRSHWARIQGFARDDDGVPICITLFVTEEGRFFELELAKLSADPIVRIPPSDDIQPSLVGGAEPG